ncbi:unnamed protein product [Danaus chrysippus]|uniref:Retinoid-inducible serine carboxypeptidase n=1 Tax=Danaus chrysippus TaxID=151541 RepID=A0A8J2R4T4_9NEOP|nr:unnamed protein product [Danaus chrysippus]
MTHHSLKQFMWNDQIIEIFWQHFEDIKAQFGDHKQDFGYVTVREGAHMFYWMYYTTANVANHTERPLIVWLEGGPGVSTTGSINFETLGPLDENLQERNYTWVNHFNVIFVDNPVGTGFSYVDDPIYLTTTDDQIALDLVELMKGFYRSNPEFEEVPLYIYGQSYGGKMAIDMGVRMREAEIAGTIRSNLRGIAMGNAWISPVDSTLTWGPLLLAAGLVDEAGYERIQTSARETERLFNEGSYLNSTVQWSATSMAVYRATTNVDFYNILTKTPARQTFDNDIGKLTLPDSFYGTSARSRNTLNTLMNTKVKEALRIPANVTWRWMSYSVNKALEKDFMKPVTESIEKLLNETDIIITKYNGNLDLICSTTGQILWVDRLRWHGAEGYKNATRHPIWVNNQLEGYYKSFGNFRFFWINKAGHTQFGDHKQDFGYVTVREGAHMFYWMYYTTANVANHTERPLIVWLEGGPGVSTTGSINFETLGPLDENLQERNYTWVKHFNVIFVDNPVGTGFSYVDDPIYLTTTDDQIALDLVELMKGFYRSNPEFEEVPLYIYGQSYGGKMAINMGVRMREAEIAGTIKSNLRGIAMGNAWISPVDSTLTWGPLLLAAGLVDEAGYELIQTSARETERLFNEGSFSSSTDQWSETQRAVDQATTSVDFYNILTKNPVPQTFDNDIGKVTRPDSFHGIARRSSTTLNTLMNTRVKEALRIPANVTWIDMSISVFDALEADFMKPVTESTQFGDHKQDFGYVTVREGAHMFYWMYYTTANVANHTERPLIVWLEGGPGVSTTGSINFETLGPLDENLQERNYTWVKHFNVIFVDNPVGTGFSYVDDPIYLTTTNDQIALDLVELMKGFYRSNPEFEEVPLYIYGQSYGGKMAIDMGVRMREAEIAGTIRSNLRGIAMGNAWISPVDSTLTWGPLLLAAGLVDEAGYELIQTSARETERLFNEGSFSSSNVQWTTTYRAVYRATTDVDFYNILTKRPVPQTFDNDIGKLTLSDSFYGISRRSSTTLNTLMNTRVKEALRIPANVTWSASSNRVFNALRTDFLKPVTESIEKLLNETDIIITKYNGNLDLICSTTGQILWVDRLRWHGAEGYKNATRHPIWVNNQLEGYYKSYGNFRFFWINKAGHTQFGDHKQDFGYVTVREGAHMFYWMYYTTANVANHTERPLIVWLEGGPGVSTTGSINFETLGPLDENLQERNYTWVKHFNVIFVDNPVGTGFSYVDDPIYLTTTNDQIALDLVELMKGFYRSNPEFEEVPLYIYGQSYGGKMAIDMGVRMREAEIAGTIRSNLRGIAMGNAWISPVDSTLTWGPLLLAAGLVDEAGYEQIQKTAREAERLFNEGSYLNSTDQWSMTYRAVYQATTNVDFYNILTKTSMSQTFVNDIEKLMLPDSFYGTSTRSRNTLNTLMNTRVKEALRIPANVTWRWRSFSVSDALEEDFMKPVTESVEKLLDETDIIITKYNGNLDLICSTTGQILWVDRLRWHGAEGYKNATRHPIWVNNQLEGYYKSYGNFRFFWINKAGHSVPRDNPAGSSAFLRDMTSFG